MALEVVRALLRRPVQPLTSAAVLAAIAAQARFQISCWEAASLEAARALGCDEDLSDGQDDDGVRVENPFHGP